MAVTFTGFNHPSSTQSTPSDVAGEVKIIRGGYTSPAGAEVLTDIIKLTKIPANTWIIDGYIRIVAIFAATNTIDVGVTADDDLFANGLLGTTIARVAFNGTTPFPYTTVETDLTITLNVAGAVTGSEIEVILLTVNTGVEGAPQGG